MKGHFRTLIFVQKQYLSTEHMNIINITSVLFSMARNLQARERYSSRPANMDNDGSERDESKRGFLRYPVLANSYCRRAHCIPSTCVGRYEGQKIDLLCKYM